MSRRTAVPASHTAESLIAEINATVSRLRVDAMKIGALLKELKKLYPQQFAVTVRERLDMDRTTAYRFMAIHDRLGSVATSQQLPAHPSTLYELTKLPLGQLEELIASGEIGPRTSVRDARLLASRAKGSAHRAPLDQTLPDNPTPHFDEEAPTSLAVLMAELVRIGGEFRDYMLEAGESEEDWDRALTLYDVLEPIGFDSDYAVGTLLNRVDHGRRLARLSEHIRAESEKCPPEFWPRIARDLRNTAEIIEKRRP